ncbi:unnamed protein product [Trypanosoma congolense IL3000]|uniref:WGS project CAEQ00000000 data, annotated contig 1578 n=1 Tax=Trypanosoma congolense (strain IL3000) TaxID=1068625 RepID=F9W783_TRYCI|nr:unnamed protein product [Trypanosoma congolense IL3000]
MPRGASFPVATLLLVCFTVRTFAAEERQSSSGVSDGTDPQTVKAKNPGKHATNPPTINSTVAAGAQLNGPAAKALCTMKDLAEQVAHRGVAVFTEEAARDKAVAAKDAESVSHYVENLRSLLQGAPNSMDDFDRTALETSIEEAAKQTTDHLSNIDKQTEKVLVNVNKAEESAAKAVGSAGNGTAGSATGIQKVLAEFCSDVNRCRGVKAEDEGAGKAIVCEADSSEDGKWISEQMQETLSAWRRVKPGPDDADCGATGGWCRDWAKWQEDYIDTTEIMIDVVRSLDNSYRSLLGIQYHLRVLYKMYIMLKDGRSCKETLEEVEKVKDRRRGSLHLGEGIDNIIVEKFSADAPDPEDVYDLEQARSGVHSGMTTATLLMVIFIPIALLLFATVVVCLFCGTRREQEKDFATGGVIHRKDIPTI